MTMQLAPKALVIDDEALLTFLVEDILRSRGYDVTVVNTRSQLQEKLTHGRYALAVTDTDLATLDEMQTWNVDQIVICSGKPAPELEAEYPHMPYVTKPFVDEDLIAVIERGTMTSTDRLAAFATV